MLEKSKFPFQAQWNPVLHPDYGSPLATKIKKVRDFVLYYPNRIFAYIFSPNSEVDYTPNYHHNVSSHLFSKQILTPDNVGLNAQVFLLKKDAPLVILFNPLGAPVDFYDDFSTKLNQQNVSCIHFAYRNHKKIMNGQDLVIDGDAVYQYAVKELKIDPSKVHFYGHSLGGAVAAVVKEVNLDSTGKYVGDRTFKSIFAVLTDVLSFQKLGAVIEKITAIFASFIAYPFTAIGWEWNVEKAFSLMKGAKLVLFHPDDELFSLKSDAASILPNEAIALTNKDQKLHGLPISQCMVGDIGADSYVATFLA